MTLILMMWLAHGRPKVVPAQSLAEACEMQIHAAKTKTPVTLWKMTVRMQGSHVFTTDPEPIFCHKSYSWEDNSMQQTPSEARNTR